MKIAIISFSLTGQRLGEAIAQGLCNSGHEARAWVKSKYAKVSITDTLSAWTEKQFTGDDESPRAEAIIFVGSCGIAVRAIAPFVEKKDRDPAVLVIDEKGQFAISLLSGHLGGANELTKEVCRITGAVPVITTATDIQEKPAVDVFAKKNHCKIGNLKKIKVISSAILAGEEVGCMSLMTIEGTIPQGIIQVWPDADKQGMPNKGLVISPYTCHKDYFSETLQLLPQCLTLGIGCKKDTSVEKIEEAVSEALAAAGLDIGSVEQVASIDLKAAEPGLLEYCRRNDFPLRTFGAEKLAKIEGRFSSSKFVGEITGVDNVCERSALAGARAISHGQETKLIAGKFKGSGVTVAVAIRKGCVNFEQK